jgi:hypothetical protein
LPFASFVLIFEVASCLDLNSITDSNPALESSRHPPKETGHVVPLDPVLVLVVEDGQAGLVKELLQALDRESAVVLHVLQFARLETGLEKTGFFKTQPSVFLGFFIYLPKRESF